MAAEEAPAKVAQQATNLVKTGALVSDAAAGREGKHEAPVINLTAVSIAETPADACAAELTDKKRSGFFARLAKVGSRELRPNMPSPPAPARSGELVDKTTQNIADIQKRGFFGMRSKSRQLDDRVAAPASAAALAAAAAPDAEASVVGIMAQADTQPASERPKRSRSLTKFTKAFGKLGRSDKAAHADASAAGAAGTAAAADQPSTETANGGQRSSSSSLHNLTQDERLVGHEAKRANDAGPQALEDAAASAQHELTEAAVAGGPVAGAVAEAPAGASPAASTSGEDAAHAASTAPPDADGCIASGAAGAAVPAAEAEAAVSSSGAEVATAEAVAAAAVAASTGDGWHEAEAHSHEAEAEASQPEASQPEASQAEAGPAKAVSPFQQASTSEIESEGDRAKQAAQAAAEGHAELAAPEQAQQKGGFFGLFARKPAVEAATGEGAVSSPDSGEDAEVAAEASSKVAGAKATVAESAAVQTAAIVTEPRLPATPEREPPVRKFPRGFMWGTATSAYQVEGASQVEGKGLSIWDAFAHSAGKVADGTTGDVTCCSFYRYKEDVALMRSMGCRYYRMSISWARLLPNGKGKVNERGVAFYNRLIDELVANKITPVVTLYHWDLPLALQMEEDGWLSPKVVDHFTKYAKLCFSRFGDRVKYWITFNEPWCTAVLGHDSGGQHAPGRTVDPSREVYKVGHHILLAHARAYQLYKELFRRKQRGKVGMALNGDWYEAKPAADPEEQRRNERAAERALEFTVGWFARPIFQGDYPTVMRERIGNRLPRFTPDQQRMLKGSADFFGLNHYSSHLCEQPSWYKELAPKEEEEGERTHKLEKVRQQLSRALSTVGLRAGSDEIQEGEIEDDDSGSSSAASKVHLLAEDEPVPEDPYIESTGYWQDISVDQSDDACWKATDMGWGVHPEGIRKIMTYIQAEYNPRGGIIITENGVAVREDGPNEAMKDIERAVYLKRYLIEVHKALVNDDVDVRGYFVWSLLDNFEWGYGFTKKFGLHYVDMETLERIPKLSANWYSEVVQKNRLDLA